MIHVGSMGISKYVEMTYFESPVNKKNNYKNKKKHMTLTSSLLSPKPSG